MPYGVIFMTEVLPTLITAMGSVGALWILSRTFLAYKQGPRVQSEQLGHIAETLEMLHQSVDDLRDEVRAQGTDTRELSGRIEFAERLLTKRAAEGDSA